VKTIHLKSNFNHDDYTNYKCFYTFMKNTGNLIENTVMIEYDELAFIGIKN